MMEGDLVTVIIAVDQKLRFDPTEYLTLNVQKLPELPKANYPTRI